MAANTSETQGERGPANSRYDVAIVGAGIVGLATARELLLRWPGLRIVVLEKDSAIAGQQSGHNSGVLHTGIYYAPGSLKARFCVAGHREMVAFCRAHDIPYELCGKLIVALDESELPRLQALYERGLTNGVEGLELIGPERLRELEPFAAGIRAIYSPNTGITDFRRIAQAYAAAIRERGGEIVTGCEVRALAARDAATVLAVRRTTPTGKAEHEMQARYIITCAGLHADRMVRHNRQPRRVRIVPFRGDYYVLRPEKRHMVRSLIYPVPDPRFPFLGVHFTRRINGEVWAGPNAVLAFSREGYSRWTMRLPDMWDTLSYMGFWRMAARYWRIGLAEMYRDYVKAAYVHALRRYMPTLEPGDLQPGPSGVRAQAMAPDGTLVDDFLIQHGERVIHVQNAPSPAATSSLVIAQAIADETERRFDLTMSRSNTIA